MNIMMLGDIGVGKTALVPDYRITVDLIFKQWQMSLGQGKLNLQLWDVLGNESLVAGQVSSTSGNKADVDHISVAS